MTEYLLRIDAPSSFRLHKKIKEEYNIIGQCVVGVQRLVHRLESEAKNGNRVFVDGQHAKTLVGEETSLADLVRKTYTRMGAQAPDPLVYAPKSEVIESEIPDGT